MGAAAFGLVAYGGWLVLSQWVHEGLVHEGPRREAPPVAQEKEAPAALRPAQ
jgi:hypothetical protein